MSDEPPVIRTDRSIWSPVHVELAIHELSNDIAASVNACSERYGAFLDADRAYDLAYAQAYLRASGAAHQKRYYAEVATTGKRADRDLADVAYRLVDRRSRALQDQLRAMQSVGASIRAAYGVAGRGEGL